MNKETRDLGRYLQAAREQRSLTLRAVEKLTEISNAYLSQLENGRIRKPSPTVLHKLSEFYQIPYPEVLQLAGYPVPDRTGDSTTVNRLAARLGPITEEEEESLAEYLDFLRSRRNRGGK